MSFLSFVVWLDQPEISYPFVAKLPNPKLVYDQYSSYIEHSQHFLVFLVKGLCLNLKTGLRRIN